MKKALQDIEDYKILAEMFDHHNFSIISLYKEKDNYNVFCKEIKKNKNVHNKCTELNNVQNAEPV